MSSGDDGERRRGPGLGDAGPTAAGAGAGASPVYTRTGDSGQTGLRGGQRVPKHHRRVEAYGTVDELNALLGWTRAVAEQRSAAAPELASLADELLGVQHLLFVLGSTLASLPGDLPPDQRQLTRQDVEGLEREMDRRSQELAPLTTFILPGGSDLNGMLHAARTVCRRAERRCVELAAAEAVEPMAIEYLNRLSDTLFVWARWAAAKLGTAETSWSQAR